MPEQEDPELIERVARAIGSAGVEAWTVDEIWAEDADRLRRAADRGEKNCFSLARAALQALPRYGEALAAATARADAAEDCIRRAHEAADAAGEPVPPYTDQADIAQFIEASMESWGILHEYEHAMYVRENGEREAETLARLNHGEEG